MDIEKNLLKDEKIIFKKMVSNSVYVFGILILGIGALLFFSKTYLIDFIFGILGIINLFRASYVKVAIKFYLTNKRVIFITGIIIKQMTEIRLEKIESVTVTQGLLQKNLNIGDIVIRGIGGEQIRVPDIDEPFNVKDKISNYLNNTNKSF